MFWAGFFTAVAVSNSPTNDDGLRAIAYILMGISSIFIVAALIFLFFHYRKKRGNEHRKNH